MVIGTFVLEVLTITVWCGAVVVTVFVDNRVIFPEEEEAVTVLVDVKADAVLVLPAIVIVSEDTVVLGRELVPPSNDEMKLATTFVVCAGIVDVKV